MLSVTYHPFILSVVMLSVIMLRFFMLIVVAPRVRGEKKKNDSSFKNAKLFFSFDIHMSVVKLFYSSTY